MPNLYERLWQLANYELNCDVNIANLVKNSNVYPRISVAVPCFNESNHVSTYVQSIVGNDYPDKLEVTVVGAR